jgi:Na+-translocating ferredoxin:NAD+ oxidoreductase subunit D
MSRAKALAMGDAPFTFAKCTSSSLMWGTVAALLPALFWGLYCFGPSSAYAVAASIGGALAGEAIAGGLRRRFTLWDGSAFLTGLLIGMAMPPGVSPFIPASASLFAVCVVKGSFGGLGSNWMNPALAGIAFALISWPEAMSSWSWPRQLSSPVAISGATPLGFVRVHAGAGFPGSTPLDLLSSSGLHFSGLDGSITDSLNRGLFSFLGAELPGGYIDLLLGNKPGAVGEISAILLLLSSIVLLARRVIRWEIPASILASFAFLTWTFGGLPLGNGFFAGDVLFSVLTGSFILVTFFMAPDPVTSPSSRMGMIIYGLGIGSITFLLRSFGSSAEGTAFAVILMNCVVPALSAMEMKVYGRRAAKAAGTQSGGGNGTTVEGGSSGIR